MFNLDELKLLNAWYDLMTEFHHSDKKDDVLIDKIYKLITEMEEQTNEMD
jgi:hypothetical protein